MRVSVLAASPAILAQEPSEEGAQVNSVERVETAGTVVTATKVQTAESVDTATTVEAADTVKDGGLSWSTPLVVVQLLWLILIAVGLPVYSHCAGKTAGSSAPELKGLNLPKGSIRGVLALTAVGSFVNVMVLGGPVLGEHFDSILAAFGTLTGSIIGFYFGNRGSN